TVMRIAKPPRRICSEYAMENSSPSSNSTLIARPFSGYALGLGSDPPGHGCESTPNDLSDDRDIAAERYRAMMHRLPCERGVILATPPSAPSTKANAAYVLAA